MENKYVLAAINEQGASVTFEGQTKKEVLEKFDQEYHRKGFRILIFDYLGNEQIFKATHR